MNIFFFLTILQNNLIFLNFFQINRSKLGLENISPVPIAPSLGLVIFFKKISFFNFNFEINFIFFTSSLTFEIILNSRFNYGPSPFLEYKYPPPTHHILTNIYNTLASVPVFYTQVLHLMNKMNLPPPFGSVLPIDPNMVDFLFV